MLCNQQAGQRMSVIGFRSRQFDQCQWPTQPSWPQVRALVLGANLGIARLPHPRVPNERRVAFAPWFIACHWRQGGTKTSLCLCVRLTNARLGPLESSSSPSASTLHENL
jgi:hypothetical protein